MAATSCGRTAACPWPRRGRGRATSSPARPAPRSSAHGSRAARSRRAPCPGTLNLHVERLRARGPREGALIALAGGPGEAASPYSGRLGVQPPVRRAKPRPRRLRPARHGAVGCAALPELFVPVTRTPVGAGPEPPSGCAQSLGPTPRLLHHPGLGRRHRRRAARSRSRQDHPVRRLVRDQGRARIRRAVSAARRAPGARLGRRADAAPARSRRRASQRCRACSARCACEDCEEITTDLVGRPRGAAEARCAAGCCTGRW